VGFVNFGMGLGILIILNLCNLLLSLLDRSIYPNLVFISTIFCLYQAYFYFWFYLFIFSKKTTRFFNYNYFLAVFCNMISISLLYLLWTKYDVPPIESKNLELFLQGFFLINGLYFLISFLVVTFQKKWVLEVQLLWLRTI